MSHAKHASKSVITDLLDGVVDTHTVIVVEGSVVR